MPSPVAAIEPALLATPKSCEGGSEVEPGLCLRPGINEGGLRRSCQYGQRLATESSDAGAVSYQRD
jgi:hypothetical protein